jgi:phosphohistidine phosphatase SixA
MKLFLMQHGEAGAQDIDSERPLTAFRPGSVVCLEPDAGGCWLIAWMIRPELLAS